MPGSSCKVLYDDRVREMPRRRSKVVMTSDEDLDDEDSQERPQQRNAANARERARMRVLSRAFCRLKTTLPWVSMRSWYDPQSNTHQTSLPFFRVATSKQELMCGRSWNLKLGSVMLLPVIKIYY